MSNEIIMYIGNWRPDNTEVKQPRGITVCSFNVETGVLIPLRTEFGELYIGAAYFDALRSVYYCCDERADYPGLRGGGGGRVFALRADRETGGLTEIVRQPSYGANPSYCVTDPEARYLLLTNYGARTSITRTRKDAFGKFHIETLHDESSVVLYQVEEGGGIGEPRDIYRISGSGPESFQFSPHAHSIVRSPDGKLFAVCDKGGDQIIIFRVDSEKGKLVLCTGSPFNTTPGSAPRYSVFHPNKPFLYVNNEYKTVVTVFRYHEDGALSLIENTAVLPQHIADPKQLAQSDIITDAAGKRLYAMVRHSNVISVFDIDSNTGGIKMIQCFENTPSDGRALSLSPDGRFLIAAYTAGKTVVSYPLADDGKICPPVSSIELPAPSTINFFVS